MSRAAKTCLQQKLHEQVLQRAQHTSAVEVDVAAVAEALRRCAPRDESSPPARWSTRRS